MYAVLQYEQQVYVFDPVLNCSFINFLSYYIYLFSSTMLF